MLSWQQQAAVQRIVRAELSQVHRKGGRGKGFGQDNNKYNKNNKNKQPPSQQLQQQPNIAAACKCTQKAIAGTSTRHATLSEGRDILQRCVEKT